MSAFAARQQLWGAAATRAASVLENGTPEAAPEIETRSRRTRSETPTARSVAGRNSKRQPPLESLPAEANQTQSSESEKGRPEYVAHVSIKFPSIDRMLIQNSSTTPCPEPSRILIRQYSSFKPNKKNLQKKAGGRLVLTTQAGEVSSSTLFEASHLILTSHSVLSSLGALASKSARAKRQSLVPS